MSRLTDTATRIPGAQALWRSLRSIPGQLLGMPPIDWSPVSGTLLRASLGRDDPTILDVGCNDGKSTLWFLELFAEPRIYCFEPDPRAIARFRANVGDHPGVSLAEIALSDRGGTIDFHQSGGRLAIAGPQGWDLSGSIREPYLHLRKHPWITFDCKIAVPTSTLDAFCEEQGIESIDLLWMDVQGAELDVFMGAARMLSRTRYLYTEYSNRQLYRGQPSLRELIRHLQGFKVVARYPGDALLRNEQLAA